MERLAGYNALIDQYKLNVIKHYRQSCVSTQFKREVLINNGHEKHIYSKKYLPKDPEDVFAQLEFAFKYDGINLEILKALFGVLDQKDIESFVKKYPTGKFARKLWYLYEQISKKKLNIPDANRGSYVLLLDPKKYYTGKNIRSQRHYVDDNLLGNFSFCPFVRRTAELQDFENKELNRVASDLVKGYDPVVISRAMHYLYAKETMSSYEIEREKPTQKRVMRFVELLQKTSRMDHLDKADLIHLQNAIVDSRFANQDFRDFQNYIGAESLNELVIHYICPKQQDVQDLMEGWFSCLDRLQNSDVNPVIMATVIAFGFVFIHPFEDGNGRLHRFMIHYILSRMNFVLSDTIFPISATMLRDMRSYDEILERFSKPLMKAIPDYSVGHKGNIEVPGETKQFYQYIDYTLICQYLFGCIEKTIEVDFREELDFLTFYDHAKKQIQEVVDMPDQKINLIIKLIVQNKGKLSKHKQENYFNMLTVEEIIEIEAIIKEVFSI
jgi:hypothetical protein